MHCRLPVETTALPAPSQQTDRRTDGDVLSRNRFVATLSGGNRITVEVETTLRRFIDFIDSIDKEMIPDNVKLSNHREILRGEKRPSIL